jgi:hypothetical protein
MIKIFAIAFFLFICIASNVSFSQTLATSFTDKKWKVKEFYVNKSPVRNTKIDSLRFFFASNGLLRLGMATGTNSPSVPYTYNSRDSLITIEDKKFSELRYKVLFFDSKNLVMTQGVPPNQDKVSHIEYRMVPDF